MDITNDPAPTADPTHTLAQSLAADPVTSTDPTVADEPLPPERPQAAPAVASAAPAPVPPPLPRHDPAPASGFNGPRPGWWNGVEAAAASEGVNSDTLWKIAGIESGFGRNMQASTSSASGPFQITNGTWDQIARLNPSLGLTDKADLGQHGKAAAALLRANTVVLRGALGRTPTDGEQYLAWFGGSSAGVKAAQAPADTPVTAIFSPAAIAANRSILGNGMTVGGLRRWADAKMAGQHYTPAQGDKVDPLTNPSGGVGWDTLSPQMPMSDAQKAILSNAPPAEDVWSLSHAAAEATTHDNMVAQLIRNSGFATPDPNYIPTAAAIAADPRARDIDKSHYPYLLGAQSDADMGQRIDALKDDLLYQRKMAERGWPASLFRLGVSLSDPAGFLLGAVSPVGSVAGKFGTMARILATGAEGAAISTGMEAAAPSPSEVQHNYLAAAGTGFLFGMGGGALGAIMHPHPDVVPAFKLMSDSAHSIVDDVTSGVPGRAFGSTAGAEQSLGHVEPVRGDVSDFTSRLFTDAETGKAALTSAFGVPTRFDLAGMTKGSENPLTAALGSRMVEDAVGNADHSAVNRAVSVESTMIRERQDTALARAYQDAWGEFRNRNGITVGQRATAEAQFRDAIADAIDNVDPTQAHDIDPAVTRAADAYRRNFADFHELAQNPGILDGSVMAPLKGMAEVEANPRYFPHIYDFLAFNEHVRRFGDGQMKGLLRDSILSHVPEMAPEDAERVASGLFKGLRNVSAGQEVSMSRMLSGDDQEGLRGFLAAETDMSREAIDRVIGALNLPEQKGTIARTKRATPINVHYEAALKDSRTGETVPVKAKDFMERDAVRVGAMYNRQMAAQVALARLRVENPRWREGDMVPKPYGPEEHLNDPATGKAFIHEEPSEVTTAAAPGSYGPVPDGHIRYFHGSKAGGGVGENGGRWVTPSYEYARDFRATEGKPNTVHYVDVKQADAEAHGGWDMENGYSQHFEAPEHIAKGLKQYGAEDRLATIPRDPHRSNLDTLREAFRQLVTEAEHGKGVGAQLTDLRKVLSKFSRAEQDAMLKEVPQSKDLVFSQIDDRKKWTAEVKEAAYTPLGPEDPYHMIKLNGEYPRAPGPKTERVPGNIRPEGVDRGEFTADGLNYHEEPDGYHISTSGLPDDLRGKGTGIAMYRMLAERAQREGKVLHSDAQLTPESYKVYKKLKHEGYDVREHGDLEFHEWDSKDGDAGVQTPGQKSPVFSIHPDPREMIREVDPNNPRYLVDGIRGASEMDTLLKKVRAIGDELGHDPEATAKDTKRLQFMYDAITGRLTSDMDRGKVGQFVRILKALNFTRVMNQVGFAQIAETWTGVAQVGIRAALSSMPELRQFLDGIRGGRGQTDLAMQLEHMATPGTEMLRGSMHLPVDDLHNAAGRTGTVMDRAEHFLHKATRATSIISGMAPFTAYQSKWMAKAALARFAMGATGEKALNTKRMRVLGISEDEQALIREQLRTHDGYVEGESGTQHRILNLDAWDPKARHALEYGLHVWVRKMIQENDIGQMNMMLGSSMGRLMGQFRMFMVGAYTKNTLHNIHMRDFETLSGILGGSVMGAATYAAQVHLQSLGSSDRERFLKRRVGLGGLASAAVSRGAFSSILPMVADLGTYALGMDPLFDTRVSGGAVQGILSSPVVGLGNMAFDAMHGISASARGDGAFNQRDARAIQGLLPFSNFLPAVWATNSMIGGLPNRDTHKHWN